MTDERDTSRRLLELAGAAAGILAYVSIAGTALISARLYALGLPVDSTLAVLPRDQVVTAGVRALSLGVVAGLLVVLVLWVWHSMPMIGDDAVTDVRALVTVPLLAVAPLLAYTVRDGLTGRMVALTVAATAVAVVILALVTRRRVGFGRLRWGLFALIAVYSGVLAFARAYSPPVELDFADVQLKDGGRTNGFLLGQSSDSVVVAPDVLGRTTGRTVALQRSEIIALRISDVQRSTRPIGSEPVSRFTVDVADPKERAIQTTLLRVRLSAQWKYPPLLYRDAVAAWRRTFDEFTRGGKPGRAPSQRTTLEELIEQTPLFAGKLVRLRGRVLQATPWVRDLPQTIVLGQDGNERHLSTCELWTREGRALAARDSVVLTGLVVASGIFVSGSGTERQRVVMVCETGG